MFAYYARLAVRSFRRNKVLTALMVVAIALGIGASMTTLTVFHVLSGDPIPGKSDRLFYVQLDAATGAYVAGEEPETQLTRFDGEALLREAKGERQALMSGGGGTIEPDNSTLKPFSIDTRWTSADFFPMFEVPMQYGRPWTREDDEGRARVVVISKALNDKLYPRRQQRRPRPAHGRPELPHRRRDEGVEPGAALLRPDHRQLRQERGPAAADFHVLRPETGQQRQHELLRRKSRRQQLLAQCAVRVAAVLGGDGPGQGRRLPPLHGELFEPAAPGRPLQAPAERAPAHRDGMAGLQRRGAQRCAPAAVAGTGFPGVCLVNTVGLLLAKFLRRSGEIGVRRALGASRGQIFLQCLVEAGAVGVVGACWASAWPCSACSRCASNRWSTQSWPTWTATCCCLRWA